MLKQARIIVFYAIAIFSLCANAVESGDTGSENLQSEFFTALPGQWNGQALETPVGSVAYALYFHQCDESTVAGVANTGASYHYWQFSIPDNALRLTFMSTFRGNTTLTKLVVNKIEDGSVWFHAPKLALLTVSMTLDLPDIHIRIFHLHQPHVYIRLTRADKLMAELDDKRSISGSCRELP